MNRSEYGIMVPIKYLISFKKAIQCGKFEKLSGEKLGKLLHSEAK